MNKFDNIRAYEGKERGEALARAMKDPDFRYIMERFGVSVKVFNNPFTRWIIRTVNLDRRIFFPLLKNVIKKTTTSTTLRCQENIQPQHALYITNHRDILLDATLLSYLLYLKGKPLPYIGIGNNLFVKPWIEQAVRAFHVFTVIRNCTPRELLANSKVLSQYINSITANGKSIWIAQREGRAKDSNDRTQPAVLKMLTMGYDGTFMEAIRALNIAPVAISYEYDPCDYLKAQEMQLKRDNPDYKKRPEDDMLNMKTGLFTFKGKVSFTLTPSINPELDTIEAENLSRTEQAERVAQLIDKHIHSAYEIFDTHRKALALMQGEHNDFEDYIAQQVAKINIPNKDEAFLRERIIEMYANPLINQMQV